MTTSRVLLIMRHAKSSWKAPLSDHERPLDERGRHAAVRVGEELASRGWLPEHVLCSDAERTRETLAWLEHAAQIPLPSTVTPRLYLPPVDAVRREIARAPDVGRLMVLCHNPACEEAVAWLTGSEVHVTTANVLRLEVDAASWAEAVARPGLARLTDVLRPRELAAR